MVDRKPDRAWMLAISSISTVASTSATAPLMRVKLLLQCGGENINTGRLTKPYGGIIDCMRHTYRSEGMVSFWRGNVPACLHKVVSSPLGFAFRGALQTVIRHDPRDGHLTRLSKNLASGSAAGLLSMMVCYPLDYAHNRLASDVKVASGGAERQFKGLVDVCRQTWRLDGVAGLYRGLTVACLGIVVYRGLYFGLYDTFKPVVVGGSSNLMASFLLGFGTTLAAGLMAYPLDTVRRRMMMRSCEAEKYRGWIDCATKVVKTEGPMALMRGALITVFFGVSGAVLLVGFDIAKASFSKGRPQK